MWKVTVFNGKLPIVIIAAAFAIYIGLGARRIQLGIQEESPVIFWTLMGLGIFSSICWLSVAAGTIVDLIEVEFGLSISILVWF